MFDRDNVNIMKGSHDDLVAVSHFLRLNWVASSVKRERSGLYGFYSVLFVDKRHEEKARVLAKEYVKECNKLRVLELRVQEIFESSNNSGDDEAIFG